MLKKLNSLTILAIITVLMVLLMFITLHRAEDKSDDFKLLYPELYSELSEVNRLVFESERGDFTLLRGDGEDWVVEEHYNYPADFDLVKRMLVDIADARILEQKTDNSEQHYILGVDRDDIGGGEALEISMFSDDELISGLILGKQREMNNQTGPKQFFVRRSGEDQTWLAEGYLQISPMMLNWINGQIINIERERIARVDIIQPSGETATLINLGEKDKFGTPESREETVFKYGQLGYDIAGSLHQMRLEDVKPVEEFSRGDSEVVQAEFLTYDGLKIITQTSFNDGLYFSTFRAEYDDSATGNVPEAIQSLDMLKSREEVEAEIVYINEKLKPWVYQLGGFVGTNLMRARSDIVTERENVIPMPSSGMGAPPGMSR